MEVTKEWCLAMARREGASMPTAGIPEDDDFMQLVLDKAGVSSDPGRALAPTAALHLAFGGFVHLMRRSRGLTIEALADRAEVDLDELVTLERDPHYTPEARTVYQLAQTFGVPSKPLMQLSGNTVATDRQLSEAAIRFAARSGLVDSLTAEERSALEQFVAALSDSAGR